MVGSAEIPFIPSSIATSGAAIEGMMSTQVPVLNRPRGERAPSPGQTWLTGAPQKDCSGGREGPPWIQGPCRGEEVFLLEGVVTTEASTVGSEAGGVGA